MAGSRGGRVQAWAQGREETFSSGVGGAAVVMGFESRALCTPGKPALGATPPDFG